MAMKRIALLCLALAAPQAFAHHGVAGVGASGLQGPGAPIESATSTLLPEGVGLVYFKIDRAQYKRFDPDPANPEGKYANYIFAGLGYGFTSWFSGYLFVPYHAKVDEPGGYTTKGVADPSLLGQIGFAYDKSGFRLIPANETLDDLEDWHFTLYGGGTVPTGNANLRDANGNIDAGKSTGFGKPSFNVGGTATTLLTPRLTLNFELAHGFFREYRYEDGNRVKFGPEYRANASLFHRTYTELDSRMRVDLGLEVQYLQIGRDRTNGAGDEATGGKIVYLLPGARVYWGRTSAGFGIKKAVWTRLNEENLQQGSEGKERYRAIFTFSALF